MHEQTVGTRLFCLPPQNWGQGLLLTAVFGSFVGLFAGLGLLQSCQHSLAIDSLEVYRIGGLDWITGLDYWTH